MNHRTLTITLFLALTVLILLLPLLPFFRVDLTSEKRFSISDQSRELMRNLDKSVDITIYSGGDVDANFARLNKATGELLDELNVYATQRMTYHFVNPSESTSEEQRNKTYSSLEKRGLRGMSVASRDDKGQVTQSVVFPWAEVAINGDTMAVCLLQPNGQRDGESGINQAIENLEFQFTDALRILSKPHVEKIAFIEGHGELSEELVYDVSDAFSRYFQVDRGVIGQDAAILDAYKAIVIAKPLTPFSESDKYIIDQYIMNGGRVLWLIDGVQMREDELAKTAITTVLPLDINLQDQLFRYGVRITNTLVQDAQCAYMPMNIANPGETPVFEPLPWFYTPLLLPSPASPITKNLMQVKADFASVLDFTSNENKVEKELLLITSNATHVSQTPATIDLRNLLENAQQKGYFFTKYQPIAASLQGIFPSNFPSRGRMIPTGIINEKQHRDVSVNTRMVVVADGDIIRNEVEKSAQGLRLLPVGYDRATRMTYGNKDFLLNALLYLTDDQDWLSLRNRTFKLHLLNKTAVNTNRSFWQWVNIALPIALLFAFGMVHFILRRKRFGTNYLFNKKLVK